MLKVEQWAAQESRGVILFFIYIITSSFFSFQSVGNFVIGN